MVAGLQAIIRPYTGAVGARFPLGQDNAVCRQFLDQEGTDAIDWPPCSPGLSQIEQLWDIMYHASNATKYHHKQSKSSLTPWSRSGHRPKTSFTESSGAYPDIVWEFPFMLVI